MTCKRKEFTDLELANYLGKKNAVAILKPEKNKHFKVIKKNSSTIEELTEDQFNHTFGITYRSHLTFNDYDAFQEVRNQCPWVLSKSSFGEDNRNIAFHFKKELLEGYVADVIIKWIDEKLGYGLFANNDICKGAFIAEFTGIVRRLYRRKADQNEYCFHYPTRWWSWQYYVIDASKEGNEARFINHSDQPNLKPACLCERNLLHIVFIANEDIKNGSQLTYDYGKDFWLHREKINIYNDS